MSDELHKLDNLIMHLDLRLADALPALHRDFDGDSFDKILSLLRVAYVHGYVEAAQEVRVRTLGQVDVDKMSLFVDTAYRCPTKVDRKENHRGPVLDES